MQNIDDMLPSSFRELKNGCSKQLELNIVKPNQCEDLIGTVNLPVCVHLTEAWLLEISLPTMNERVVAFVGSDGRTGLNSSAIRRVDFEEGRAITSSGNVYGFNEIRADDPDEVLLNIVVMLNNWGLRKMANVPHLFY